MLEIVDALDVDEQLDPLAAPRCRRPSQDRTGRRPALAMAFAPLLEQADLLRAGIEFERGALAVEQRGCPDLRNRAELHDHGDAPRTGQHRDMARGTAAQERQTTAAGPVDLQEARGRQIVGANDGAARNFQSLALAAPQDVDHTVAQVREVRGARLQIFVRRRIVIRDLRVERRAPCDISRIPIADRCEDRLDEILILQERDLEFENLRGFAAGDPGKIRDLPACPVNCSTKGERFLGEVTCDTRAVGAHIDTDERAMGKADRGGPAAVGQSCRATLHVMTPHPENRLRSDRPGLRRRPPRHCPKP